MRPEQLEALREGLMIFGVVLVFLVVMVLFVWLRGTWLEYRRRKWLARFTLQMQRVKRQQESFITIDEEEARQISEELWDRTKRVVAEAERRDQSNVMPFPGCRRQSGRGVE